MKVHQLKIMPIYIKYLVVDHEVVGEEKEVHVQNGQIDLKEVVDVGVYQDREKVLQVLKKVGKLEKGVRVDLVKQNKWK